MNGKRPAPSGQPLSTFNLSDIPDNDPGWLTAHGFIDIGVRRLKNLELAIADVAAGFAAGDIPAMHRFSSAPKGMPTTVRISPELAALLAPHMSWHRRYLYLGEQGHYRGFGDAVLYLHIVGAEIIWPAGGYRLAPTDPPVPPSEEASVISPSQPATSEAAPKRPGPKGKSAEQEFVLAYWRKHPELLKPGAGWSKLTLKALQDAGHAVSLPALKRWRTAAQKDPDGSN